jgi:hypothetical protein
MAYNIITDDDNITDEIKRITVGSISELKYYADKVKPRTEALNVNTMDLYSLDNSNTWVKIGNLKEDFMTGASGDIDRPEVYVWDGGNV